MTYDYMGNARSFLL